MRPQEEHKAPDPSGEGPSSGKRRDRSLLTKLGLPAEYRFDYKDTGTLKHFISPPGKIIPRRLSGLNATQQRDLVRAIKRARAIALLPVTGSAV
jgi:small subunit ribosomal protein S18